MTSGKIQDWQRLTPLEQKTVLERPKLTYSPQQKEAVMAIIAAIKLEGQQALLDYTKQFDKVDITDIQACPAEIAQQASLTPPDVKKAIDRAYDEIKNFHQNQVPKDLELETTSGISLRRLSRPIEKVGLYIPGGTAPLPSTVLMTAIPARIAGCNIRVLASPPGSNGLLNPAIYYAAQKCQVTEIYKAGGAQAIAALAYGTEVVPKVDKIVGPGNSWVTLAKQLVATDQGGAAIDMPAGPSEVLVLADESADASFVAWDLLSQAEHGVDSQVVLVSTSSTLLQQTMVEIEKILADLPRGDIAKEAMQHARFILASSRKEAIEISNAYGPEHLIVQMNDPEATLEDIINAGSIFLGPYTPESVGDYASGTNHVLPTSGWAKAYSGLSVDSFIKRITVQQLSQDGLRDIGPVVETLAACEGLDAHKGAVSVRLRSLNNQSQKETP